MVLNNDCPVDMGRRTRLGNKDCHFLSDAAQGKLNCRVHSQGKCVGSLGEYATRRYRGGQGFADVQIVCRVLRPHWPGEPLLRGT